ncbi:MAG: RNase H family protein [Candidatus Cyclobacteriaceae bacterium M3_2C_046]
MIKIFTDGCYNQFKKLGAWVAYISFNNEMFVIHGVQMDTSHQRMELMAAINALEWLDQKNTDDPRIIYTDSQYLVQLPERFNRLVLRDFFTAKGQPVANKDLVKIIYCHCQRHQISFIKVKGHPGKERSINFQREADKLCRRLIKNSKS